MTGYFIDKICCCFFRIRSILQTIYLRVSLSDIMSSVVQVMTWCPEGAKTQPEAGVGWGGGGWGGWGWGGGVGGGVGGGWGGGGGGGGGWGGGGRQFNT